MLKAPCRETLPSSTGALSNGLKRPSVQMIPISMAAHSHHACCTGAECKRQRSLNPAVPHLRHACCIGCHILVGGWKKSCTTRSCRRSCHHAPYSNPLPPESMLSLCAWCRISVIQTLCPETRFVPAMLKWEREGKHGDTMRLLQDFCRPQYLTYSVRGQLKASLPQSSSLKDWQHQSCAFEGTGFLRAPV